jgi:purine-nucleoside/S-methyl-5'-thioadenosine phosphorylase / adenosine deaminase
MSPADASPSTADRSVQALRPAWPVDARVCAAVTRRRGGVSPPPFESLNLAAHVGDDPAAVAENRRRVRAALGLPDEPLWLSQVHGATVMDADRLGGASPAAAPVAVPVGAAAEAPAWEPAGVPPGVPPGVPATAPQADAAITRRAGRVLAVLVADCLPVLLAHRDGGAVGVAHAGWRGLAAGVLEATVGAFGCPAGELTAWLGPAIGPAHFEVGEEVRAAFCGHDAGAAAGGGAGAAHAFRRNERGRWQCDLALLARQRLASLGVHSVHGAAVCSYSDAREFYSYRRDGRTGRVAALIWIEPGRTASVPQ